MIRHELATWHAWYRQWYHHQQCEEEEGGEDWWRVLDEGACGQQHARHLGRQQHHRQQQQQQEQARNCIDYSKWDNLDTSSEEDEVISGHSLDGDDDNDDEVN